MLVTRCAALRVSGPGPTGVLLGTAGYGDRNDWGIGLGQRQDPPNARQ
jgi:hypothetical protein